jgi:hypothetical protein
MVWIDGDTGLDPIFNAYGHDGPARRDVRADAAQRRGGGCRHDRIVQKDAVKIGNAFAPLIGEGDPGAS